MPLNTIITKEYPAELAGERVGWTTTAEITWQRPVVVVNAVVATVGSDGARHGYNEREGEEERLYSRRCDEGFVAVSGLRVLISREIGIDSSGVFFSTEERKGEGSSILQHGANGYADFTPDEESRLWADNRQEFIDNLNKELVSLLALFS